MWSEAQHQRQGCDTCKSNECAGNVGVNSSTASATELLCLQKQGICRPAAQCGCHQQHTPGDPRLCKRSTLPSSLNICAPRSEE